MSYLLMVTMKVDEARHDLVDAHLRNDVAPWAGRQAGFVSGQWIRLPGGDRAYGLVSFDSAEAAEAAAIGPRAQPADDARAWNTERVDVFEVIASAEA
jgi:hypothetical protein